MRSHYEFQSHPSGLGYQFSTDSGLDYQVYFIEYFLGNHIIYSFGIDRVTMVDCTAPIKDRPKYDGKIRMTVWEIIRIFFEKNGDDAILYLCQTNDERGRHRKITFSRWFRDMNNLNLEKHNSRAHIDQYDFFASLIIKRDNPLREGFIKSFHDHLDEQLGIIEE